MALDVELRVLLIDRQRIERELAHVLKRAGPSDPDRAKINKQLAKKRKTMRDALRLNSEQIASRLLSLHLHEL